MTIARRAAAIAEAEIAAGTAEGTAEAVAIAEAVVAAAIPTLRVVTTAVNPGNVPRKAAHAAASIRTPRAAAVVALAAE
jgi:hypothetical protein